MGEKVSICVCVCVYLCLCDMMHRGPTCDGCAEKVSICMYVCMCVGVFVYVSDHGWMFDYVDCVYVHIYAYLCSCM